MGKWLSLWALTGSPSWMNVSDLIDEHNPSNRIKFASGCQTVVAAEDSFLSSHLSRFYHFMHDQNEILLPHIQDSSLPPLMLQLLTDFSRKKKHLEKDNSISQQAKGNIQFTFTKRLLSFTSGEEVRRGTGPRRLVGGDCCFIRYLVAFYPQH